MADLCLAICHVNKNGLNLKFFLTSFEAVIRWLVNRFTKMLLREKLNMKFAKLYQDGFRFHEEELPELGKNDLLIKTIGVGICSGDVHVYRHRDEMFSSYNRLGHEASGEVVAVGQGVIDIKVGDIVTSMALPSYSTHFVSKRDELTLLPDAVSPKDALGEAVACCVHAADRFGIQPDDKVAIIGCGFMGLICQQLAVNQGAGRLFAFDLQGDRREMALLFGAEQVFDPTQKTAADLVKEVGTFDVVIEAAGAQGAIDYATELVGLHGRIILVGYHQSRDGMRTVNMERWNYKAIDVVNGHVRRLDEKLDAMTRGMAMMAEGKLVTKPLVTFYDFEQINLAFEELVTVKTGLLKGVLLLE